MGFEPTTRVVTRCLGGRAARGLRTGVLLFRRPRLGRVLACGRPTPPPLRLPYRGTWVGAGVSLPPTTAHHLQVLACLLVVMTLKSCVRRKRPLRANVGIRAVSLDFEATNEDHGFPSGLSVARRFPLANPPLPPAPCLLPRFIRRHRTGFVFCDHPVLCVRTPRAAASTASAVCGVDAQTTDFRRSCTRPLRSPLREVGTPSLACRPDALPITFADR